MLDLMLRNGSDPNARDEYGNDPLHYAIESEIARPTEKVEMLRRAGADPSAVDGLGRTTLDVAQIHNLTDTINLLLAREAPLGIEAIRNLDIRAPDPVHLQVALRGETQDSLRHLFQPPCNDPEFLEKLAAEYKGRVALGKKKIAEASYINGLIIRKLQSAQPKDGRLAVFKAEFECSLFSDLIKASAWYRWAPAMLTEAFRKAGIVMDDPRELEKGDFATDARWRAYQDCRGRRSSATPNLTSPVQTLT